LKRIRVLLAGMPTLMLDIIHHVVAAQPDMAIVGTAGDDLPTAAQHARADVLVVGHDNAQAERDFYLSLLLRSPQLRVLALADDGKSGWLYDLRPRRKRLQEISARSLASAIRGKASPTFRTSVRTKRSAGRDGV
jgi:DNA-binding NarL/FixJ family response regulator